MKYDLDYFKKRIKVDPVSGCWIWQKSLFNTGYGQFAIINKKDNKRPYVRSVHRYVYQLVYGPIPKNVLVRHKPECVSRACCNPEHLMTGTNKDNYWDSRDVHMKAADRLRGARRFAPRAFDPSLLHPPDWRTRTYAR